MTADPLKRWFPNAISSDDLAYRAKDLVWNSGGRPNRTLLAASLCSDEVCAASTRLARSSSPVPAWRAGRHAVLWPHRAGRLRGACPNRRTAFLWYGPHVGPRRGGAARPPPAGPSARRDELLRRPLPRLGEVRGRAVVSPREDPLDAQQAALETGCRRCRRILAAEQPQLALTEWAWRRADALVADLLAQGRPMFAGVTLIVLGGVMINTAPNQPDGFDIRREEVLEP